MSSKQDSTGGLAKDGAGVFNGIPVSRGFASGKACLIRSAGCGAVSDERIPDAQVAAELERLEGAVAATKAQIAALVTQLKQQVGDSTAAILDGHLMILDDPFFYESCKKEITLNLHNAEWAANETARKITGIFSGMDDPYLRERSKDVGDIVKRILRNLQGKAHELHLAVGEQPCVIVAGELFPSETLALPKHLILGIATDHGSATSHASLLARALQIPAVVGLGNLSEHVRTGDLILLDGANGTVTVKPDSGQQRAFEDLRAQVHANSEALSRLNQRTGVMRDGHPVPLLANVDYRTPAEEIAAVNAEGVGLFRSEYQRSEERRVGKECRSRWSPYH